MTYSHFEMRFAERKRSRSAYQNFLTYLDEIPSVQVKNRVERRCRVRLVKIRGDDCELSATQCWETYQHSVGRL